MLTGVVPTGISILPSNGDGAFTAVAGPGQLVGASVGLADLNNDGIADLVFPSASNSLAVYLGNGDGTFTQAPSSPIVNVQLDSFAIADLSQDGVPDIVYANPSTAKGGVLFGSGDGFFDHIPATLTFPYYISGPVVTADFNGDGWPDVLAMDGSGRNAINWLTQPTETATASATVSIGLAGTHLAMASYAGDSNYNASVSNAIPLWGIPPATTTSLTITSGGSAVTSVAPGTVVTLTATVNAGASPVSSGEVNFCDASATYCTDIHVLGTAHLASNGTATFKFVPGPGTHSYKAEFVEDRPQSILLGRQGAKAQSRTNVLTC